MLEKKSGSGDWIRGYQRIEFRFQASTLAHTRLLPSLLPVHSPVEPVEWTLPPGLAGGSSTKIRHTQGGAVLQVREVELEDVADGNTITCSANGMEDSTATLTVRGEKS